MSSKWKERAQYVLAGGPGTFSKSWHRYPHNTPPVLMNGRGCRTYTTDGHEYIDTVAGLGTNLLGFGHPLVQNAAMTALHLGTSFSLLHPYEVEAAEKLQAILPGVAQVRWMKNGSDATNAAVRLARLVTGKQHIICSGYHGANYDWYGVTTERSGGILQEVGRYSHQIPWGNAEALVGALEQSWQKGKALTRKDLAAIIVEVPTRPWEEDPEEITTWLTLYRDTAHDYGAIFILDEVITMLRYSLGGAQEYYRITADLVTGGKALANGHALAVLAGPREFMKHYEHCEPFCSYTFAGEVVALAACKATLDVCATTSALHNLRCHGQALGDGLVALLREYELPGVLWGNYARMAIRWHEVPGVATAAQLKTLWMQEMLNDSVLIGPGVIFPMTVYSADIVQAILRAAAKTFETMRRALETNTVASRLLGPVLHDVFAVRP